MDRRRAFALLILCSVIAACNNSKTSPPTGGPEIPKIDPTEAYRIKDTISTIAGPRARVIAVCGESKGITFYDNESGFTEDGVSGQFGVSENDGQYDVIFSSSAQGFISSIADGAQVSRTNQSATDLMLTVGYPSGVSESYLFSGTGTEAKAIYVAVKRATELVTGAIPARGRVFVASCYLFDREGQLGVPNAD